MDDNSEERDTGLPPVGTPEELEEALKWLEELTARQGKPADLANPVPAASIDSPFRGLIEGDEGDLPDWLREVPTPLGAEGLEDTEPESRLDWLAKMAQRESIEELPTLEWRRLSEPMQSAILADQNIDLPTEVEQEPTDSLLEIAAPEQMVEEDSEIPPNEDTPVDITPSDISLSEIVDEFETAKPLGDVPDTENEPAVNIDQSEPETPAEFEGDTYDAPVPVDDLDAAMAWIEEFAASQDAPIEEVPSVADRALASKLMMEAGLPPVVSPLDELGSDSSLVDGMTPTHPFIEEEDYADTVVLVETLAADQETTPDFSESTPDYVDEPSDLSDPAPDGGMEMAGEPELDSDQINAPDELSFEEAMALLDKMATEQSSEGVEPSVVFEQESSTDEMTGSEQDLPVGETLPDALPVLEEESSSDFIPTPDEQVAWMTASETYVVSQAAANGIGYGDLESTLLSLDTLALPPGKTLSEIDATLRAARTTAWRDIQAAMDWLESSLAGGEIKPAAAPVNFVDETELIAQMPEDPDAVLAWLESMASEEESRGSTPAFSNAEPIDVVPSTLQPEPLVEHLVEADLLNMPDDPDEAMAWLEGLARDSSPPDEAPPQAEIEEQNTQPTDGVDFVILYEEPDSQASAAPDMEFDDENPDLVAEYLDEALVLNTDEYSEPTADDIMVTILPDIQTGDLHEDTEPALPETVATIPESINDQEVDAESIPAMPVEHGEEQPAPNTVAVEPTPEPAKKRSRAKAAKPAGSEPSTGSPAPDVETVDITDEMPVPDEFPMIEKPAEVQPRIPSWVDLLKPLD